MSTADPTAPAWTKQEFEAAAAGEGPRISHPSSVQRHAEFGRSEPEQIRGWVANRYYYQINIPLKDAAILANCPDREVRRSWVQRILDHDGYGDDPGGIESWLRLAEAVGLDREHVENLPTCCQACASPSTPT